MKVSYFPNVREMKICDIYITEFLDYIKNQKFDKYITEIRNEPDKAKKLQLKQNLPCITASGKFSLSHKNSDLIQHSGFIQVDIDGLEKDRLYGLKTRLLKDQYTHSLFISPGGNGLKLLFKIPASPRTHLYSFLAIEKYFLDTYEISIDRACKDVSRPMFISSDPDLFYNPYSALFSELLKTQPKEQPHTNTRTATPLNYELYDIETICNRVIRAGRDITTGYHNWIKLAFALSKLGEPGRAFFHQLSEMHPNYSFEEADKQFTKCLRNQNSGITLKSFYYMARESGINVKV